MSVEAPRMGEEMAEIRRFVRERGWRPGALDEAIEAGVVGEDEYEPGWWLYRNDEDREVSGYRSAREAFEAWHVFVWSKRPSPAPG